jgi:hypothetical protein
MLDLGKLPTKGNGRIIKVFPKKDTNGGIGAIIWDVDIAFDVKSLSDAKVLDRIVSGASSVYESGQLGGRAEAKDQSEYEVLRFVLFCESDNSRICSGHCEIKQSLIKCNGPKALFILKIRMYGLITNQAIELVNRIEEDVFLYVSTIDENQISTISQAEKIVNKKYYGDILLTNSDEAYIILKSDDDGYIVTKELCAYTPSISEKIGPEEIKHILNINNSGYDFKTAFESKCYELDLLVEYFYIVKSLMSAFVIGQAEAKEDGWSITEEVVDRAIEIYKSEFYGKD